ncbi:MAG: 50S ribosomal protein L24 [bacterium]|nr:MAG: 50S ribosomal protein L24 [bacterium]
MKFKKGDTVKITAGKDKGREGKIEAVLPKINAVVVPEINMYKKHVKGFQGQKGGIYDLPRPVNTAKVAIICPSCKKQTRVTFKIEKSTKVRICVKCNKNLGQ